ncbi:hypothetical protein JCM8208_003705 [Rhodotorula glutinis]
MSRSNGQDARWNGGYAQDERAHAQQGQRWRDYGHEPPAGPSGWNGGGQYTQRGATSFDTGPPHQPPHLVNEPYFPDPQWPTPLAVPPPPTPQAYLDYGQPWVPPMPAYNSAFDHRFNPFSAPFVPYAAPFHPTPPAFAPGSFSPSAPAAYVRNGNGDGARRRGDAQGGGPRNGRASPTRGGTPDRPYRLYDRRDEPRGSIPRRSNSPTRRRAESRSRSPEPYAAAPAPYGPDGEYIPPTRRVRQDVRSAPVIPPTETYLAASSLPSTTLGLDDHRDPLYLVMDLNQTLLARAKRDRVSSRWPIARPYLSTFLSYICTRNDDGSPRFEPIVYSSARAPNVLSMLAALHLVPPERATAYIDANPARSGAHPPMYEPRPDEGDVLRMVFTRSMMGLSNADYHGDVETVKDLARVWELLDLAREAVEAEEQQVVGRKEQLEAATAANKARAAARAGAGASAEAGNAPLDQDVREEQAGDERRVEHDQGPVRLNKKAKGRVRQQLDEQGSRRTLLLDDEASKVAQQPYSHLPISPFLVHPMHFPPAPTAAFDPRNPVSALSLDPTHPPAQDCALLITIAQLERARAESNVAGWVRAGGLDGMRDEVRTALGEDGGAEVSEERIDEELVEQGRAVCARYGIEPRQEWDSAWREKLLHSRRRAGGDE